MHATWFAMTVWLWPRVLAAITLTSLLASGIVFTLGCCALCSCLRVSSARKRNAPHLAAGEALPHDHHHEDHEEELRVLISPTVLKTTKSISDLSAMIAKSAQVDKPSTPTSHAAAKKKFDLEHEKQGLLIAAAKFDEVHVACGDHDHAHQHPCEVKSTVLGPTEASDCCQARSV
jgi:hypothetical protein